MKNLSRIVVALVLSSSCLGSAPVQGQSVFRIVASLADPLTGQVTVPSGSDVVTGVGTLFESELRVGEPISIAGELFLVAEIASDTQLSIDGFHGSGALDVTAYRSLAPLVLADAGGEEMVEVDRYGNVLVQETVGARAFCDENGENCASVGDLAGWRECRTGFVAVNGELCIEPAGADVGSWYVAAAIDHCSARGGHVCTAQEWLAGCRGGHFTGTSTRTDNVSETYLDEDGAPLFATHYPSKPVSGRCSLHDIPAANLATRVRCCHTR